MKAFMPVLLIALTFSLASCNSSSSSSAKSAPAESKFTANLSAAERDLLDKEIMDMFKHAIFTVNITENNGCKITMKDQVSSLKEGVQSISYRKPLATSASKECGFDEIGSDRAVEVTDPDNCEREYERHGNIVRMKACSDDIVTIDMNAKTASGKISGDSTGTMAIQAITINKAELANELKNVTIIYKGTDGKGEEIEISREVGNAIEIFELTL